MKKTAGFTLVELIVVIAILGILAGIAIPVYSGYITKAQDAADLQQLDAIKTAAVFAAVDANNDFGETAKIEVTANGAVSAVKITNSATTAVSLDTAGTTDADKAFKAEVELLLGGSYPTLKGSYKSGAVWASGAWAPAD